MSASTQLITDMKTANTTGPSTLTQTNSIAAAGPIVDVVGLLNIALIKLEETNKLLTAFASVVDTGDPIKTTVANVLLSLV